MIEHLYIVGNGFDVFTGLKTKYSDFREWLEYNYCFIYELFNDAYGPTGEWWNNFEEQLGNLDIKNYVAKYPSRYKTEKEIIEGLKKDQEKIQHQFPISLQRARTTSSKRLEGLLDVLQYCFEKWIEGVFKTVYNPQYIKIEKENSYFINFNYTDVLEVLYEIPENRVLHIHGRASKKEHLVFGHGKGFYDSDEHGNDTEQVAAVLRNYEKNPYEHIFKYQDLPSKLDNVKYVHVYGFSFSQVDLDYIAWIQRNSPNSQWDISWHTQEDKDKIDRFLVYDPIDSLIGRFRFIQLKDIQTKK